MLLAVGIRGNPRASWPSCAVLRRQECCWQWESVRIRADPGRLARSCVGRYVAGSGNPCESWPSCVVLFTQECCWEWESVRIRANPGRLVQSCLCRNGLGFAVVFVQGLGVVCAGICVGSVRVGACCVAAVQGYHLRRV